MKHHEGTLIFMTDPICSWCWGMLPELLRLKEVFTERLNVELKCAGLQVGGQQPLSDTHLAQLVALWQQVAETTGQTFAYELPDDANFIYHSELACRLIQLAREDLNAEPLTLFYRMQEAFYVDCRNLGDLGVLFELHEPDYNFDEFEDRMCSDSIVNRTRQEFEWCKTLGISALPTLFLDLGDGPKLISGGYATADFLIPEIADRLTTH